VNHAETVVATKQVLESIVAAYMFIWGILMVYQFTVSRRVSNLRQEVERLKETLERGKRN
jgi:CcmD family protein